MEAPHNRPKREAATPPRPSPQPYDPTADARRGTPGNLLLRTCLVGLVVQIVVGIIMHGADFLNFRHAGMNELIAVAVVLYAPILVAANMGYQEGQGAILARWRKQAAEPPELEEW